MRRRATPGGAAWLTVLAALVAAGVAAPSTEAAAAAPRIKVSALVAQNTAPYQRALSAFKRSWDGPVQSHVLEFEDDAVARVKAEEPTLVLAVGVKAAKAAQALGEVPVVYCMVLEPRANGVGAPHVLGVPLEIPAAVQLAQLKRVLPAAQTVGVVYNPARSGREVEEAQVAAGKLGLTLHAEPATSAAQFPEALKRLVPRVQALWLLADPTVVTLDTFQLMLETATANRLPLLVFNDDFVRRGALFAVSPDFEGAGLEAARLARELAAGKKPRDIAPAQARWNLVLNLGTAKALGLTLPAEVLQEAVRVQ